MSTLSMGTAARRAAHSTWLKWLTRVGFVTYGLFHLAIAWIAVQIATGRGGGEADQAGAFRRLDEQPLGHGLLIVTAVGLLAMAVWQLLLALAGHREYTGGRRVAERIASAGRVAIYLFLFWTDLQVLRNPSTSSASSQQHATAGVLGTTGGRFLIVLAGLVVLGIGLGMIWYGGARKFESKLTGGANPTLHRGMVRAGQFGYVARGAAFAIVGGLLINAALGRNAERSRGLDGALRTLVGQPYGPLLLGIVALGFAAFGVYCFFQARYRRI